MKYLCNHTYKHNIVFSYLSSYSISGCPFPRNANNTIASVIATPAATPYAAIPASAICIMK